MKKLKPESLMMSHGYKSELSVGAIKCPIFQTSTFEFQTAEEGKRLFEMAYGHRKPAPNEEMGLIYSRINNPDLEILENRLCLWDEAEDAAVFESGMSAISTVMLEFLSPGDLLLMSAPVYGGTDHFTKHVLDRFGIELMEFSATESMDAISQRIEASGNAHKLALIHIETPANPTNAMIDLQAIARLAKSHSTAGRKVITAVDNTYMGPLWQHPLKHGADLVIYSATKYIGGHSDLIAGAVLGSRELMVRVKTLRTFLGNMTSPYTGWLLMRSLETLKVRMDQQASNADKIAEFLHAHPETETVYFPGIQRRSDKHLDELMKRQCSSNGAMISFDIRGGEKEAFTFLNALKLVKLAVSLGSTESLAQHPATMTHVDLSPEDKLKMNVGPKLVRISVGVENVDDLIWDIEQALQVVREKHAEHKETESIHQEG